MRHFHLIKITSEKKWDIEGKIPKLAVPPPSVWENPCHKKIKDYFAFYGLWSIFGFHQNCQQFGWQREIVFFIFYFILFIAWNFYFLSIEAQYGIPMRLFGSWSDQLWSPSSLLPLICCSVEIHKIQHHQTAYRQNFKVFRAFFVHNRTNLPQVEWAQLRREAQYISLHDLISLLQKCAKK